MADTEIVACLDLPKIPEIPSIKLLGGAELKGLLDFSLGTPTDCKLTFNLLLQLSPLLASMACLLKMLDVIGKLQKFVEAVPSLDPFGIADAGKGLIEAINKLSGCIPGMPDFNFSIVFMIKGMLELIINFLLCFISQIESLINFQLSINLEAAEGNPVLHASLTCALDNAQTSMDNLMLSLQPLQPILLTITTVAGLAQLPLNLPDLSTISAGQDHTQTITSLRQAISSMKQAIEALPI
jgi:hypothetical protein